MDGLSVGHEVHVAVLLQERRHPVLQDVDEAAVLVEPGRVEGQRHRSSAGGVVTPEVVLQEAVEPKADTD